MLMMVFFTPEDFVSKLNYDLANDLGNLLNRTIAMINKYTDGVIPALDAGNTAYDAALADVAQSTIKDYNEAMQVLRTADALAAIWKLVARANKYIDETTPWILAKDEAQADNLKTVMANLAAALRVIAILLQPILTHAPKEILTQLGLSDSDLTITNLQFKDLPVGGKVIKRGQPIFPRVDVDAEVAYIREQMAGKSAMTSVKADEPEEQKGKDMIEFDDFDKVELRVAQIKEVSEVAKSKKLLRFKLDDGTTEGRTILSGIKKYYPDYKALEGKKVAFVANLKPRKMMGELSEGMILSAEKNDVVTLSFLPDSIEVGAELG